MLLEKEAIKYLVDLGEQELKIKEIGGFKYSNKDLRLIQEPKAVALKTSSLTSLIDYVNSNHSDLEKEELIIHVAGPTKVYLYGGLDSNRVRETFMICDAITPDNVRYDSFLEPERFNIMLQSSFVDNESKKLLLKMTGIIREENIQEVGDDGVGQGVTVKTGVATVGVAKVPNPVELAPFRTFQEVKQPVSKFVFRMQSGPRAALFEADGSMWRNEAIISIKEYLKERILNVKILG